MSELTNELLADAKERMGKSVQSTNDEFGSVRTGRASPALLDRIVVDYYGAPTPLKQLATINAPEARLLTVQPYDASSIKSIEKAIMESDIGLTPNNDGRLIRLGVPELNEERRRELVKVVRHIAEEGRVAIRNIRRDVMHDLRELKDAGEAGADDEHRAEVELQKLTDGQIAELDGLPEGQGSGDPRGVTDADEDGGRPRYVAIITDGNGRWAKARGLPVVEGHQAGADVVKARLRDAAEFGIRELTVYSFSTENWSRPAEEVTGLMRMFSQRILRETPELKAEGVRMRFIGRRERVAARAARADGLGRGRDRRQRRDHALRRVQLRRAGGDPRRRGALRRRRRGRVPRAALRARDARPGPRHPHERRAADVELPALAVGVRELVFRDELWPDFSREAFAAALDEFAGRRRRFGGR